MGIIKEPIDVDFSTKSEPWTPEELSDFREIMNKIKARNAKRQKVASKSANGAIGHQFPVK